MGDYCHVICSPSKRIARRLFLKHPLWPGYMMYYLYPEDLDGLTSEAINSSDSTDIVERYIQSWIKKQLLIDKASTRIDFDEAELTRKILDYQIRLDGA